MDEGTDKPSAMARASRLARQRGDSMYVVWTGQGYAVASEDDLDTWWLGATVVAEVMGDGTWAADD